MISLAFQFQDPFRGSFQFAFFIFSFFKIRNAEPVQLDRWLIDIRNQSMRRINMNWLPHRKVHMYNYFSIGVDAQVTFNFHKARESPFYMISSRIFNKVSKNIKNSSLSSTRQCIRMQATINYGKCLQFYRFYICALEHHKLYCQIVLVLKGKSTYFWMVKKSICLSYKQLSV